MTAALARAPLGWQDRAACRETDPDLFFPAGGPNAPATVAQEAEALAVCDGCSVRSACRRYAETTRQVFGVWGGTTEADRQASRERSARRGRVA